MPTYTDPTSLLRGPLRILGKKLPDFINCASYVPGSETVTIDALPASYVVVPFVYFVKLVIERKVNMIFVIE